MLSEAVAKRINDKHTDGSSEMHLAALRDEAVSKVGKFLLKNGCDVNATTESGATALDICATAGRVNLMLLLLEHGGIFNTSTSPLAADGITRENTFLHDLVLQGTTCKPFCLEQGKLRNIQPKCDYTGETNKVIVQLMKSGGHTATLRAIMATADAHGMTPFQRLCDLYGQWKCAAGTKQEKIITNKVAC
jgi:hypothetical protein